MGVQNPSPNPNPGTGVNVTFSEPYLTGHDRLRPDETLWFCRGCGMRYVAVDPEPGCDGYGTHTDGESADLTFDNRPTKYHDT